LNSPDNPLFDLLPPPRDAAIVASSDIASSTRVLQRSGNS